MVIPFNEVPFTLEFSTGEKYIIKSENVKFTNEINDLNDSNYVPSISIRENNNFYVNNLKAEKVLMKIEGFDEDYEISGLTQIFSYNDFPLVPGFYLLTFVVSGSDYYSILEITPSQISTPQWKILQQELLTDVKNLAYDLVKCNLESEYGEKGALLDRTVFYQFKIIDDMFGQVMHALADLESTANVKIEKEYIKVPANKSYQEDARTIMFRQQLPNKDQTKLVPIKYPSYNLPENRFLKKVITDLKRVIKEFIEQIDLLFQGTIEECREMEVHNRTHTNRYKYLSSTIENTLFYRGRAERIREAITMLESCEWFNEVEMLYTETAPITVMMDSRYRVLYKLFSKLNKHKIKYSLSEYYSLRWKRTDQLYELWGFIQVYKSLLLDGYHLVDGLKFIPVSDDFVFEDIKAGKSLLLSRDEDIIRLIYNGEIPNASEETDIENNPIYTTGLNRLPDCRIDCYKKVDEEKQYYGSIVIDFKYRKFYNVWQSEKSSKHQLMSYKNDTATMFYRNMSPKRSKRTIKPVFEVMILYPDMENLQMDEGIRFVSLVPGKDSLLKSHLDKVFTDIYEDFEI